MAKFLTGNYGSSLQSYAPAAQYTAQAGAIKRQGIESIRNDIVGAMEKYKLDKEKKEKEANSATMLEAFFTNNPGVATQLGMDPNDPQSISAGAKAGAKNPETFGLISVVQQMGQRQAQANMESERFKMEQDMNKFNLGQAENKARKAEEDYAATKLDDVITMAANLQNKGETIPDAMKQQLYMYSNNLGRPLEQTKAEIDNKVASIRAAEQTAELQTRKLMSETAENIATAQEKQANAFKTLYDAEQNATGFKRLQIQQDQMKVLQGVPIKFANIGPMTFGEIQKIRTLANSKDKSKEVDSAKRQWGQIRKAIEMDATQKGPYYQTNIQFDNLIAKMQQEQGNMPVMVDDGEGDAIKMPPPPVIPKVDQPNLGLPSSSIIDRPLLEIIKDVEPPKRPKDRLLYDIGTYAGR